MNKKVISVIYPKVNEIVNVIEMILDEIHITALIMGYRQRRKH